MTIEAESAKTAPKPELAAPFEGQPPEPKATGTSNVELPEGTRILKVVTRGGTPIALRGFTRSGKSGGQWALADGAQFTVQSSLDDARYRAATAAAETSEQLLRGGGQAALITQRRIGKTFTGYIWMLGTMFVIGIAAFVAAVVRGFTAASGTDAAVSAIFGGLSAASFVTAFLSRPINAMGRAGPNSAWLLAIVNTYWSKLAYLTDPATVIADLDEAQQVLNRNLILYLKYTADPVESATGNDEQNTHQPAERE